MISLTSGDSGTSAGSSIDSVDLEVVVTDLVDTDSFDGARDLRKKTSALRVRGKVVRRSDLQEG